MRIKLIFISMLLASCGGISKLPSFTAHKIEIRQGNMVTSEMRSKLKLGMSRVQVRALLGTPLVSDALHANRWDYVYRLEQEGKLTEQQRMTVYFDGDVLTRIDDGNMPPQPAAASEVAAASAVMAAPTAATPAATEAVPDAPVVVPVPDMGNVTGPGSAPVADGSNVTLLVAEQAVVGAVHGWAAAWSARDVAKYLACYSHDFKPANGLSRAAWAAQRSARITKEKSIKVELSDIKASMQDDNRASVSFKQSYRADKHTDVMRKTLELEKVDDAWLIVSERATKK